jgi:hypothetical protein
MRGEARTAAVRREGEFREVKARKGIRTSATGERFAEGVHSNCHSAFESERCNEASSVCAVQARRVSLQGGKGQRKNRVGRKRSRRTSSTTIWPFLFGSSRSTTSTIPLSGARSPSIEYRLSTPTQTLFRPSRTPSSAATISFRVSSSPLTLLCLKALLLSFGTRLPLIPSCILACTSSSKTIQSSGPGRLAQSPTFASNPLLKRRADGASKNEARRVSRRRW